jgi:CheY-like chemotaxis protein
MTALNWVFRKLLGKLRKFPGGRMTRILLADDDAAFGFTVKQELEQRGFSVDFVHDGVEAVLNCMDKPYACILMDGQMPRLHGVDALRIIKKVNPGIPAILISGDPENREITEFAKCSGTKCLAKPFEVDRLEEEIRNNLT